jgi:hypothetical protein
MQTRLGSGPLAFLLVLGCALLRIAANLRPDLMPNFTPCVALAFIAAVYLPHRWSWLLGLAAVALSEAAFLRWNVESEGRMFSGMMLLTLGFYALLGGLGVLLARRKSLALLVGGPLLGSILFYLATNTACWWGSLHGPAAFAYAPGWTGWIQANTTGLPGYPPTWTFLRNGLLADLLFSALLIAIFEPARLGFPTSAPKRALRA